MEKNGSDRLETAGREDDNAFLQWAASIHYEIDSTADTLKDDATVVKNRKITLNLAALKNELSAENGRGRKNVVIGFDDAISKAIKNLQGLRTSLKEEAQQRFNLQVQVDCMDVSQESSRGGTETESVTQPGSGVAHSDNVTHGESGPSITASDTDNTRKGREGNGEVQVIPLPSSVASPQPSANRWSHEYMHEPRRKLRRTTPESEDKCGNWGYLLDEGGTVYDLEVLAGISQPLSKLIVRNSTQDQVHLLFESIGHFKATLTKLQLLYPVLRNQNNLKLDLPHLIQLTIEENPEMSLQFLTNLKDLEVLFIQNNRMQELNGESEDWLRLFKEWARSEVDRWSLWEELPKLTKIILVGPRIIEEHGFIYWRLHVATRERTDFQQQRKQITCNNMISRGFSAPLTFRQALGLSL